MTPEQKKYILSNYRSMSAKRMAQDLGLKEKNLILFVKSLREKEKAEAGPAAAPADRWIPFIWQALILCAFTLLIYSNSFLGSFQFDDRQHIQDSSAIRDLSNLGFVWKMNQTRILTVLTFALNYQLGGKAVFGYHVFNFMIHLLCGFAVLFLTRVIFETPALKTHPLRRHVPVLAFFTALIFLSHPLQTQAVTYIVQRAASLAALFYFSALACYLRWRLGGGIKWHILALAATVAAMFCKPTAFTIPAAMILFEFIFFGNPLKSQKTLMGLAPFLMTLVILPLVVLASHSPAAASAGGAQIAHENLAVSRLQYFMTQFRVLCAYLRLLVLPVNQNFDYDFLPSLGLFTPVTTIPCFLLLAGILAAGIKLFSRERLVTLAVLFFFLSLSVESSLIPLNDFIEEHRLYLPMFSFALLAGVLVIRHTKNIKTAGVILSVLCLVFGGMTFSRNKVWQTPFTLWDDVIRKSPQKARPYMVLGVSYYENKNFDKAIELYQKSLSLQPENAQVYFNLSNAYDAKGLTDQQITALEKAIKLKPDYAHAYSGLAFAYGKKGVYQKTVEYAQKAISIEPYHAQAHQLLGSAYVRLGKKKEAQEQLAILEQLKRQDDYGALLKREIQTMP